ncbi:MAG: ferritin family protein [Candidatus Zixiibacteriota bacterium]
MNVEQALKTALEFENKVHDAYREMADAAEGEVGKKVFGVLADEERHHVEYLESRLTEWQRDGSVTAEGLETAIPRREDIEAGVEGLSESATGEIHGGEVEMLRRALHMENEASAFYQRMVKELPEDARPLFARFVEIEDGHTAIVQAELDYASGSGFMFDFRDFAMS